MPENESDVRGFSILLTHNSLVVNKVRGEYGENRCTLPGSIRKGMGTFMGLYVGSTGQSFLGVCIWIGGYFFGTLVL
jgi:hypothetical protein